MKKTALAAALLLVAGTASASTFTISVTNMDFGGPSAVTGSVTGTEGVASGSFGGTFFYQPWTATAMAVFEGAGSYNWSGTGVAGDTANDSVWIGSFNYNFTLAAGQAAFGLSFDWSTNYDIPVLAIFDCGTGATGSTCTGIGGAGPNGGVPMQVGPFPGQDPSFDGYISAGSINAVPVPAAVWLFGSGLLGLAGIARRRKAA